ncbi:uncharacterized protein DNG_00701 [Cephalotrichum gorgonifer]|uniref:Uncharacterized protein n=1 Tax=Cephalotrichum gorgonifer TaxID=2041049 RepID=A0AAE8MP82_9PEZI|nr:uncharacterized protein DNG_00701 [Cephalotrichum gorgonifer]
MSTELLDLHFPESRAESGADPFRDFSEKDSGMPVFKTDSPGVGHVFLDNDMVTFKFKILSGKTAGSAQWVVLLDDGNPVEITSKSLDTPLGPVIDSYIPFTVTFLLPDAQYWGRGMYIVLTDDALSVSFASGIFSVAKQVDQSSVADDLQSALGKEGGPTEANSPWRLRDAPIPTTPTISGLTPTATDRSKDSSTDTTTGIGGSRGLSNGAKAGIGAGVGVVGLIIIGLAIWFFLRRRRRGRQAAGVAGDDTSLTPAAGFIHDDKDPHATRVADSPNSPVSDDERVRDSAIPAAEAGERSSAHAPSPNPEQPRDIPSAMAHLVEEGMTEAEIRRLEEEERALDQAIEQAGRR